ncbi:MAG: ribonuclease HII [Victivallaceae bacterium]|nr:ribonuclease HII [Victivallaceae bacterium]
MPESKSSAQTRHRNVRPPLVADDDLLRPERGLWAEGFSCIAGIDEAGRGCLAGPVVAAAVVLPRFVELPGVYDSKQLSDAGRRELFRQLKELKDISIGVGIESNEVIDEINILKATHKAMRKAAAALDRKPDVVLVDGLPVNGFEVVSRNLVDGDALSASIAAASIIAKVTRDDIMLELAKKYPEYGFAGNKGYGTPEHLAALKKHGPCAVHRMTFHPVMLFAPDAPEQLELL